MNFLAAGRITQRNVSSFQRNVVLLCELHDFGVVSLQFLHTFPEPFVLLLDVREVVDLGVFCPFQVVNLALFLFATAGIMTGVRKTVKEQIKLLPYGDKEQNQFDSGHHGENRFM